MCVFLHLRYSLLFEAQYTIRTFTDIIGIPIHDSIAMI